MKNNRITFDQGNYLFEIGASSKDIKGTVSATMNGTFKPELKVVVADCNTVVLKSGATTQTSVTAAMTDDSFYDIAKAKIVYASNNPAVATVDSKGVVTAKASGVATITAAVTVDNKTVEGNYPIKVVPDLNPVSITVNKKVVPGFNVATMQYSYLQGKPSAKAPVVNASSSDPDIVVETHQAKGVPGTAAVSLTDYNTFETKEYAVNFGTKSTSDEFDSNAVGKQWHWLRENAAQWEPLEKIRFIDYHKRQR